MSEATPTSQLTLAETCNFLLTNRIPRRLATRFMGWFSRLENPLLVKASIRLWRLFAPDLDLSDAAEQDFSSLHECFTRRLKADARPIDRDPGVLVSPCDAQVGEFGDARDDLVLQAKGFPYALSELLADAGLAKEFANGRFVTLRLKSSMYHHFHAPASVDLTQISYISGDTWNVNPIALRKIEKLFCRNERAVVSLRDRLSGEKILLVPVAAVLVASMRFVSLPEPLNLHYAGANLITCRDHFAPGQEMGHFEHGSTIIMLTSRNFEFSPQLRRGQIIRMGTALMRRV